MASAELEKAVQAALNSGKYDFAAIMQLLRSNAAHGEKPKKEIVCAALMYAIAQVHTNDFAVMLCMISERVQESRELAAEMSYLLSLEDAVERGNFTAFWSLYRSDSAPKAVPRNSGLEVLVRTKMAQCVSYSLTSVSLKELLALLGVASQADLTKALDAASVKYKIDGEDVVLVDNALNAPHKEVASSKMDLKTIEALCN